MPDFEFKVGPFWLSQRPDGRSKTWYITWYDPGAGTARRKSTRTSDLEAAKGILTQHYLESSRPAKETPQEAYVGMVLADYLRQRAPKITRKGEHAALAIQHFVAFLEQEQNAGRIIGAAKVSDLSPRLFRRFMEWRAGPHGYTHENAKGVEIRFTSKGVCGTTISTNLDYIRSALNRAYKDGELTAAPFVPDVDAKDKSPPRQRVLTPKEFASHLDSASDHLFMFLLLSFCTGGRPEAILELGPHNIDWHNDLIDLNQPGRGLTRKRRPTLPIAKVLRPWLLGCTTKTFVSYVPPRRSEDPQKYRESVAEPRALKSIKTAFRASRRRAKMDADVTAYTIRHTVATELRKRGVPEWEVKAFMGHAAMSTTDRYAKYDPSYLQWAVEAIDAYFEELKQYTTRHVRDMTGIVEMKARSQ